MKLIKNVVGEYHLIADKCPDFVSISEPVTNGFVIASLSHEETDFLKLSQKNCESIALGYDLDELAEEYSTMSIFIDSRATEPPTIKEIENAEFISEIAFKNGFKKALEILGDRKFTEEDMKKALHRLATSFMRGYSFDKDIDFQEGDRIIKSLQQNEWEVEIEMEESLTAKARQINGDFVSGKILENAIFPKPLLDSEGNIILKRV